MDESVKQRQSISAKKRKGEKKGKVRISAEREGLTKVIGDTLEQTAHKNRLNGRSEPSRTTVTRRANLLKSRSKCENLMAAEDTHARSRSNVPDPSPFLGY